MGENVTERKQLEELLSRIPTLLNCPNPSVGVACSIPPGSPKERKTHKGIPIRSPGLGKAVLQQNFMKHSIQCR